MFTVTKKIKIDCSTEAGALAIGSLMDGVREMREGTRADALLPGSTDFDKGRYDALSDILILPEMIAETPAEGEETE